MTNGQTPDGQPAAGAPKVQGPEGFVTPRSGCEAHDCRRTARAARYRADTEARVVGNNPSALDLAIPGHRASWTARPLWREPTVLLCRECGSRRCACCRREPRRPASAPGSRSRGRAATLVNADLAPGPDELGERSVADDGRLLSQSRSGSLTPRTADGADAVSLRFCNAIGDAIVSSGAGVALADRPTGKRSGGWTWRLLGHESGSAGMLASRHESGDRQAALRPHRPHQRHTRVHAKARLRADRHPRLSAGDAEHPEIGELRSLARDVARPVFAWRRYWSSNEGPLGATGPGDRA